MNYLASHSANCDVLTDLLPASNEVRLSLRQTPRRLPNRRVDLDGDSARQAFVQERVTSKPSTVSTSKRPSLGRSVRWYICSAFVVLGALWQFARLPDASDRLRALPAWISADGARELPLTETETAVFAESKVLKRVYEIGEQQFLVEVVDSSSATHAPLDPLFSLHCDGWNINENNEIGVPGGTARHLKMSREQSTAEAVVWISDTQVRHASESRRWWQTVLRRVTFGVSGPEPVLVIVRPVRDGTVAWSEVLSRFPALFEI